LIVHGRNRDKTRARMLKELGEIRVSGLQTNIAFLRRPMADDAFASADLDTGLIERRFDSLFPKSSAVPDAVLALAAGAVLQADGYAGTDGRSRVPAPDPCSVADGWRVSGSHSRVINLIDANDGACDLILQRDDGRWTVRRDE